MLFFRNHYPESIISIIKDQPSCSINAVLAEGAERALSEFAKDAEGASLTIQNSSYMCKRPGCSMKAITLLDSDAPSLFRSLAVLPQSAHNKKPARR